MLDYNITYYNIIYCSKPHEPEKAVRGVEVAQELQGDPEQGCEDRKAPLLHRAQPHDAGVDDEGHLLLRWKRCEVEVRELTVIRLYHHYAIYIYMYDLSLSLHIYIYIYTCICIYVYMYVCMYVCMCIYIYIYIYIYLSLSLYIYISISIAIACYIFSSLSRKFTPCWSR